MDQFASKVVEKCLKIGGPDFLERYLARVCEGRSDRPRIPLIDSTFQSSSSKSRLLTNKLRAINMATTSFSTF